MLPTHFMKTLSANAKRKFRGRAITSKCAMLRTKKEKLPVFIAKTVLLCKLSFQALRKFWLLAPRTLILNSHSHVL